jgi:hypothetical protein
MLKKEVKSQLIVDFIYLVLYDFLCWNSLFGVNFVGCIADQLGASFIPFRQ